MLTCKDAEALMARRASGALETDDDAALVQHLRECGACRPLADDQALVARALTSRPEAAVPLGFTQRLSDRLDAEVNWADMLNWRMWTVRLAPVAAALMIAAATTAERVTAADPIDLAEVAESWAIDPELAELPTMSLFWQAEVSADSMLEAVLTADPDDPIAEAGYDQ
jgi:predicted anti-sigma-YlaC factor YlaD